MSRATGAATSGAGSKRRSAARPAPEKAEARGPATDEATAADADKDAGKDAGAEAAGAAPEGRGRTMTETRGPQPYHPPKAYEPPAERAASESAEEPAEKSGKAAAGARKADGGASPEKAAKADTKANANGSAKATAKGAAKAVRSAPAAEPAAGEDPARTARPATRPAPRTRKARLRVAKVDPWSVMKVSFLLSVAVGVCTIVAAAVLWSVMDAMGVFQAVGGTVSDATASGSGEGGGFDLESFLSLPHVLLFTSIIAVIDVVLATALATLGAFVYNLSAGFVGGVELTLAEDE